MIDFYLLLSPLFIEIKRLAITACKAIDGFCNKFTKKYGLYNEARTLLLLGLELAVEWLVLSGE